MNYSTFINSKEQPDDLFGFKPVWIPDIAFGFQKHLDNWIIRKGRGAIYADCGLGKSLMELVWLENIVRKFNKSVLLLTPLAVAPQMVQEGEKFGVKCYITKKGKVRKGINVTNYERLHYFDPKDFIGVAADECFPAGTLVDVVGFDGSLEQRNIEDIQPGQKILNASGIDHVKAVYKRQVYGAVRVRTDDGRFFTCSPNHPVLTVHGWRRAEDLQAGDHLVETKAAMLLMRGDIHPQTPMQVYEILWNVLLCEMENESSNTQSEGSYSRSICQNSREDSIVDSWEFCFGYSGQKENSRTESNEQSRECSKNGGYENKEWDSSSVEGKEGRERTTSNCPRSNYQGSSWKRLGGNSCQDKMETKQRIVNELSDRLRKRKTEDCNRNRWQFPSPESSDGIGQEERQKTDFPRVDSVEIFKQGCPELEGYRDETGSLYFYDIEATRHPSFSVEGLLVHNSSVLKNFDGKRRRLITDFLTQTRYRLLCTATPSPNDYSELGTSSEALGGMGRGQMLGRFFTNGGESTQQWELKGHARAKFWRWICSWARALRKPSDLGFSDDGFILPKLYIKQYVVKAKSSQGFGFVGAKTLEDQRRERRLTIKERCEKVAEIVPKDDYSVIWCHLNPEGDLLEDLIPGSIQVAGSDRDEVKEERLTAFARGEIKTLITKPKIGCFGLNWQHCNQMFFFPDHSYERYYQSIRRCWRFGQMREVFIKIISSQAESMVIDNMRRKEKSAEEMFISLVYHMKEYLLGNREAETRKEMILPSWLK